MRVNRLGRVLVVDDEVELNKALCETLTSQGYEARGVLAGEEALTVLKQEDFDILLTDLLMPGMGGIELLEAALKVDSHIVGIVMTGHGTIRTAVEAMKIGAFDYVLKPFKMGSLLPVVSRAMEVRRLRMENLQLREMVGIYELSMAVAFTFDSVTILNKVAEVAAQACGADEVSIMLPTEDGKGLYVAVSRGREGHREHILGHHAPMDRGVAGWVARHKQLLMLHGEVKEPDYRPVRPRAEIHSSISMPMLAGGNLVGVLNVNAIHRRPFTLGEIKALNLLIGIAAPALEGTRLYEQVRNAETKYRAIFENAIEGIFQADLDGRLLTANPSLARMLGYDSCEELMASGTNIGDLYVDSDRWAERNRLLEKDGFLAGFECRVRRKDGRAIWVEVNAQVIKDKSGKEALYHEGAVEDITERKQSEEALRKLTRTLRVVSECNQALVHARKEPELLDQICRIIVDEGGYRMSWVGFAEHDERKSVRPVAFAGYEEGYLDGLAVTWADTERGRGPTGVAIRTGKPAFAKDILTDIHFSPWRSEALGRGYRSSIALPLIVNNRALGVLQIYSEKPDAFDAADVAMLREMADDLAYGIVALRTREERDLAEEALRQSGHYYRSLLTSMYEDILVVDRDYRIRDVNKDVLVTSGLEREQVIGRCCYEVLHGCSEPCMAHGEACMLQEVFETKQPRSSRHQHVRSDGSRIWVDSIVSPLKDESDNTTHVIKGLRDVTHEVQLRDQLRQAQKMEAIGTLSGGIAHDFNNILGIILGYTELALFGLSAESPERENLEQVRQASLRAKDLVTQILTFSRRSEKEANPLQIGRIVKEALKLLRAALPSTIEIRREISTAPGEDSVLADPTQIHQVIMNLCTNAGHAMQEKGGILEVSLSRVEFDSHDTGRPPDLNPGSYLRLTVSDTGHGIDHAIMDRIFEPYFTTKGPGEGTGLGLAVVHGIVKGHDGAITVQSTPGMGTTFDVFLPCLKAEGKSEEKTASQAVPGGTECILLVDDEEALAKAGKRILEHLGYRVIAKTSSTEALEAFRAQPNVFDLVITDLTMPQMTGIDLAGELMSIRPDIPIILCTGFSDSRMVEKAGITGIRKLITKPLAVRKMAAAVRHVLDDRV